MRLWMTKPPPKASRANRSDSLNDRPPGLVQAQHDFGRPGGTRPCVASTADESHSESRRPAPGRSRRRPAGPGGRRRLRPGRRAGMPGRSARPPSAPRAVANEPTRLYQANTSVRRSSVTMCESAACSTDRNGPTSFPLGLMTPMVAARSSSNKVAGRGEHDPGQHHQDGPDDQRAPPPEPIGGRRQPQGDRRVARPA